LKTVTCPPWSTAVQDVVEAQETELTSSPASMLPNAVQLEPFHFVAFSALTAIQKVFDRQDTETNGEPPLAPSKAVHELPEYLAASPASSTAAQNEELGQDTELSE
jgi:hypothetical protein